SSIDTARVINDIGSVKYPEGVRSPLMGLNIHASDGKFRYDREFLLQFMDICTEKPGRMRPLDALGIERTD
ncbi:eukaryotic translation initiation factor 4G1-domain-containing protein, partial [Schizophyllum fasciatum]